MPADSVELRLIMMKHMEMTMKLGEQIGELQGKIDMLTEQMGEMLSDEVSEYTLNGDDTSSEEEEQGEPDVPMD